MKILALFTISMMILGTSTVFACDGSCNKDKDKQAFTTDVQELCGGCTKPKPAPECGEGGTCEKCSKDKKAAPEPKVMCGGSGCGSSGDKDKEKNKT